MSGRPKTNIWNDNLRALGMPLRENPDLEILRMINQNKHHQWTKKYKKWDRLRSSKYRELRHPIWEVYRDIEIAMITMGVRYPPPLEDRPFPLKKYHPFDVETFLFRSFTHKLVAETASHQKGPKRDAEKLYRTAVSTAVARKMIQPHGGDWRTMPSPRQISQAWYLVFGEHEPHDRIKHRLPLVGRICKRFVYETAFTGREHFVYKRVGETILRKRFR